MVKINQPKDLLQILLSVLFISVMIVACLWIVQPFLLGFAWAGTVVIATWPLMIKLQRLLWGKRILAVIVMILLLLLVFIIPITLLITSVIDNSGPVVDYVTKGNFKFPAFEWLNTIPLVGHKLFVGWNTIVESGSTAMIAKVRPYVGTTTTWFIGQAAHIGALLVHCALMLLFSVVLYAKGEDLAHGIRHFAFRLADKRGDASVLLAGQAIRAVALGVVVTALVQAVLGGIGLAIAGIPFATILTVLMIMSCLVQLGPLVVLIPAVIWLYWSGDTTWGTVLLVWSAVVGSLDGVIRPVLIRMGADLPLILILSGVIGGLLAFGMIGLFIGPVLLAVSYRLLAVWTHEVPMPSESTEEVLEVLDDPNAEESTAK